MRFLRNAVIGIALSCAACAPPPPLTPTPQTIKFQPNTGAIVELDIIQQASCGQLPTYSGETWTPQDGMISELEAVLAPRLIAELARSPNGHLTHHYAPGDYYRRYGGARIGGRQIIVVCGEDRRFYDEPNTDWRTHPILYRGGGEGSFGAHYDPQTGEITYFEFGYPV